ncbi:hypothetical protein BDQ17DRAFT_908819 [Cyathus striatus]|nr:hypothetical protein BDQ17DRAFT_908819 [Cyathus striatus]
MRPLSFPIEILHEIVEHTSASSLPNLRLACKIINEVVVPCMFRHACIRYSLNLDKFLGILHAFGTGEHPCVSHAKTLTIQDLGPEPNPFDDEDINMYDLEILDPYEAQLESIQTWIQLALLNCRKVNAVIWKISRSSTMGWGKNSVLFGLKNMSTLTSFTLYARGLSFEDWLSVSSLPPLQVLKIRGNPHISLSDFQNIHGLQHLLEKSSRTLRHLELDLYYRYV